MPKNKKDKANKTKHVFKMQQYYQSWGESSNYKILINVFSNDSPCSKQRLRIPVYTNVKSNSSIPQ